MKNYTPASRIAWLFLAATLTLSACGQGAPGNESNDGMAPAADTAAANADAPESTMGTADALVPRILTGNNAELLNELELTRVETINAIQNLSLEQWIHRESDDRWNIAETMEHMVSAERLFRMLIETYVIQGAPDESAAQRSNQTDDEVVSFIQNRANAMSAPSQIEPAGVYSSVEQGLAAFKAEREQTMQFVSRSDANLRAYAQAFPGTEMRPMDAYQWVLYLNGHSARHLGQIAQVRADAEFPY